MEDTQNNCDGRYRQEVFSIPFCYIGLYGNCNSMKDIEYTDKNGKQNCLLTPVCTEKKDIGTIELRLREDFGLETKLNKSE